MSIFDQGDRVMVVTAPAGYEYLVGIVGSVGAVGGFGLEEDSCYVFFDTPTESGDWAGVFLDEQLEKLEPLPKGGPIRDGVGEILGRPVARRERNIHREELGEAWPLTVDAGVVALIGSNRFGAVTFTADGVTYAVNGLARSWQSGKDIDPIWAPTTDLMSGGPKMNIGPIIEAGLDLSP
jgi:hypothetical protein